MMGLIKHKAAAGDPESIRTLAFLQGIGFKDEPKVKKELELWEILDMCVEPSKYKKDSAKKIAMTNGDNYGAH